MKNICSLLLALCLSSFAFASTSTVLSVGSVMNEPLSLELDGYLYEMSNKELTFDTLAPGYHSVRIYQGSPNTLQRVLYDRSVYVLDGYHVDILINRFGTAFLEEKRLSETRQAITPTPTYYSNMSDADFRKAKQSISSSFFDDGKMETAKQIVDFNYFTSAQVKELVQLFTLDHNQLEIAKYAYFKTLDQNNYHIVGDAFTFPSTKRELSRFVRSQP